MFSNPERLFWGVSDPVALLKGVKNVVKDTRLYLTVCALEEFVKIICYPTKAVKYMTLNQINVYKLN